MYSQRKTAEHHLKNNVNDALFELICARSDKDRLHHHVDNAPAALAYVIPLWSDTLEGAGYWFQVWKEIGGSRLLTETITQDRPILHDEDAEVLA